MLKSWMAPAAAALAVLLLAGTVETADAKKGPGGGWSGGGAKFSGGGGKFYAGKVYGGGGTKFYGGKVYYGNKHARLHHRHRFVGVPLVYGYGAYAYSDGYSCAWLRRRALDSGSSYWWNRYYACIDGDYYN
jgi:hypothetical protein